MFCYVCVVSHFVETYMVKIEFKKIFPDLNKKLWKCFLEFSLIKVSKNLFRKTSTETYAQTHA